MLPISEVQGAVYQALTAEFATAPAVPVWDAAGPNEEFPYITLGEFIGEQSDTLRDQGVDLEMTVHFWSRQPGMQEVQQLMQRAKDALHGRTFAATGFDWVATTWQYGTVVRDADMVSRHGILRFRVMTFQQMVPEPPPDGIRL